MRYWLVFAIACGGKPAPAPTPSGPPASLIPARHGADDVEVARVNGRPIWGSCVAAQAAHGSSREQALHECIDFELLAQAAEARGLASDREVVLDTRTAMVNQLVGHEFEDKFTQPAEFGEFWTKLADKNRWRLDHAEVRGSAYVRVQDEVIAKELAAALANERGLMAPHLKAIAERVVAGRSKLEFAPVPPTVYESRMDETFANALFAIREVGRVSPPTHTRWGWDIILFDSVIPAAHPKPGELATAMLPDIKRAYFPLWVNKLAQSAGAKITVLDQNVPLLEKL